MQVEELDDDGVTDEQLEAMDVLLPKLRDDELLDLYESDDQYELDEFDDLSELEETLDVKEANDDFPASDLSQVSILSMARAQHVGTLYDYGEYSRYVPGRIVSAGAGSSRTRFDRQEAVLKDFNAVFEPHVGRLPDDSVLMRGASNRAFNRIERAL
jgi:hypothetical protein